MIPRLLVVLILTVSLAPPVRAQNTDALLDTLQHAAFRFFWEQANPANGLVKDRDAPGAPCSIASLGFGLSAIAIGIDHGWITRAEGRQRVLTTLNTLYNGPQGTATTGVIGYQGFFYHFLDMNTATRAGDTELSSIDTSLLLGGVLDVRQYFDGPDPDEALIRARADSIYFRVNWNFMRNFNPWVLMGWMPGGQGFSTFPPWIGYNEAMILYILALGSPSRPVPENNWSSWTSGYDWETHYGYTFVRFEPLFGHQYSHCWVDFRGIRDPYMVGRGIDYFENSRRATLAQRAYCIANPGFFLGYGDSLWGITAGDGPDGYEARGAPPAFNDDGTITPTAAIASLPFAPEVVIPFIRNAWNTLRPFYWGPYGWVDGWNFTRGWVATDVIGIDQGPILLMIENYRTGRVWNRMMANPHIQTGLARAGFVPWVESAEPADGGGQLHLAPVEPNPLRGSGVVRFRLATPEQVTLTLHDAAGRRVSMLSAGPRPAGEHALPLDVRGLEGGVYFVRLRAGTMERERKVTVLR